MDETLTYQAIKIIMIQHYYSDTQGVIQNIKLILGVVEAVNKKRNLAHIPTSSVI